MFSTKIKLERALFQQVAEAARRAGYASAREFVQHVLEREVAGAQEPAPAAADDADEQAQIDQQLRGLGYLE